MLHVSGAAPSIEAKPMNEADLINCYFRGVGSERADVALGIGDDAALLRCPAGSELLLTTDALVQNVHFVDGAPPRSLGHRALAINLSDIAAMGGEPAWALLSLTMPQVDEDWLAQFARGMDALACDAGVSLVGGNLSRGPLMITVQMAGFVPVGQALRRTGARVDDDLYVSGMIGEAGGGRMQQLGQAPIHRPTDADALRQRFEFPVPRTRLGMRLRGLASACIDVSDGLLADASRLAQASGCGAVIDVDALPLSTALRREFPDKAVEIALTGGEDYELCFTAPKSSASAVLAATQAAGVMVTRIGHLQAESGVTLGPPQAAQSLQLSTFDHFGR